MDRSTQASQVVESVVVCAAAGRSGPANMRATATASPSTPFVLVRFISYSSLTAHTIDAQRVDVEGKAIDRCNESVRMASVERREGSRLLRTAAKSKATADAAGTPDACREAHRVPPLAGNCLLSEWLDSRYFVPCLDLLIRPASGPVKAPG